MNKISAKEARQELTMILLYLSRFSSEKVYDKEMLRSWKTYPFSILNELEESEYIYQGRSKGTKSVWINDEGVKYAKKLLEKYGISED